MDVKGIGRKASIVVVNQVPNVLFQEFERKRILRAPKIHSEMIPLKN